MLMRGFFLSGEEGENEGDGNAPKCVWANRECGMLPYLWVRISSIDYVACNDIQCLCNGLYVEMQANRKCKPSSKLY